MNIFKKIVVCLNIIRFWPHILCYLFGGNRKLISEDLAAYRKEYAINGSAIYVFLHLMFFNKSFRSLFYNRIGVLKWLIMFLAPGMQHFTLTNIPIGGGLLLFHAYGTILNAASIGKNCRIVHNVTLGDKNGGKPVIGDSVEILANAVIFGDIHIGNNCVIGPGAVVFKSIPDNCVVVGNPAYILKQNGVVVNQKL
ncbi:MAG: serine acetyltransferase [Paludibacter sp.]